MAPRLGIEADSFGFPSSACPVGVFQTDADGKHLAVSASWSEITGLAPAEALGRCWVDTLHQDDRDAVVGEWTRAAHEKRPFAFEFRVQRPDGAIVPAAGHALAERDEQGRVTGFTGSLTDLTQFHRLMRELRESEETQAKTEATLRARNDQLRQLTMQLAVAQEHERRRIAMGLHEQVGQPLAIARAKIGQLLQKGKCGCSAQIATEIRALMDHAIGETRSLTFELSSPVLHELGLAAALESLSDQIGKESDIQFYFEADLEPESLTEDLRILLYRVARELCFNVVRHARASAAKVRLYRDGKRVHLVVLDDGQGFDASAPHFSPNGGFGLFAIREMIDQVGGRFEIQSSAGRGTRVLLSVPNP